MSAELIDTASTSPVPPFIFSTLLLSRGLTATRPIDKIASGSSGASARLASTLALAKPTRVSCFLFGFTNLLGSYMIYDNELENGAGFTFAWSTLYLLVNGGASIKSAIRGRVVPLGLSVLALGNVGLYGRQYFWPSRKLIA
ncbi:hypothetical protein PSN45_001508 [Yamadazyma tenuis]|uniref:Uncharacterized protein n=1 Tax=Candida tenuis (strain ATCC 10573 / BCRC 21748 / CBS 615 / JCM 9827 / NBRC 10315 / NRRL Y-1498 / VKM Y-70) TaxID=590646 RepID=G3BFJ4_CANTC|nr:uncharacterized protein CANTEDRAFT_116772 [Yamadazyma tenuis ATCC 10573]XP_006690446.1 uncharacterized protein CANTEDRAFT_116772 [Yamadazyma tenuis ATCC 10573]EGV61231.1 hypothetical protein CANTEDRAFT_116772 [Yamadazyma tenuis ATCC 10573]EGV61232.1 hypothetical protein CANTEDRAFT_116772 [Yamadazyma tenuis ATCC 10573]WEJ94030.1 hypothetical protein PSN45_001508 [Yamadazyma tenuis]